MTDTAVAEMLEKPPRIVWRGADIARNEGAEGYPRLVVQRI